MVCCHSFSALFFDIDIGGPLGCALGPILCLIYIIDLAYCSKFKTTLHADDSILILSHKNIISLEKT